MTVRPGKALYCVLLMFGCSRTSEPHFERASKGQQAPAASESTRKAPGRSGGTMTLDLNGAGRELGLWQAHVRYIETGPDAVRGEVQMAATEPNESNIVNITLHLDNAKGDAELSGRYQLESIPKRFANAITWTTKETTFISTDGIVAIDRHQAGRVQGKFSATFRAVDGTGIKRLSGQFGGLLLLSCFVKAGPSGVVKDAMQSWERVDIDHPFCRALLDGS